MTPTQSLVDLLTVLTPLFVSTFAFLATVVGAIGLYVGRKNARVGKENSRSINEIHIIVNSQKTEMLREIDRLKLQVQSLEESKSLVESVVLNSQKFSSNS